MHLLEMSFSGAVFIIAIVSIRAAAIHKLPKKTFLILWDAALFRLLLPLTIPSIFSIYTLIDHSRITPSFPEKETGTVTAVLSQMYTAAVQDMEQPSADLLSSVSLWFIIWCAGVIFMSAFFIYSYLRCQLDFRTAIPVNNAYARQWLHDRPLKRKIMLRQSDQISTPLTYGILRPVILMPKNTDWDNTLHIQYILSHEYVHICRFDALMKLVAALVLCIHWFNPFVWVLYFLYNRDLELACDESVIRQLGTNSRSAYSLMLIGMEAKKCGLPPFYSNFGKYVIEERITAIMKTKQTTPVTILFACLIVLAACNLFATSATSHGSRPGQAPADNDLTALTLTKDLNIPAEKTYALSVIHESADLLYYEDGAPYIHDILTNNTDQTIVETQYGMLAYDENGAPLALFWNFLDSNAESSFENLVRTKESLLSGQTEEYRGGWSLYDGEVMTDLPKVGDGGPNQVAYSLLCLKQVVFEDGAVWNNPGYENWLKTYAGKETPVDELQTYYPYEYRIVLD